MNLLKDPVMTAGALRKVAGHFGQLGAMIPGTADMAQRARQLEKLEPGLLSEDTVQRPRDKLARLSRKPKTELFGNVV